ncbi:MAG: Uma2 family endonuclease [Desulfuromonadaceae bacterium]
MPQPKLHSDERYTYTDYLKWDDDKRWELIDGQALCMSPGPVRRHQHISKLLGRQIDAYLSDKSCEMYYAPFDVRFIEAKDAVADDSICW